MSQTLTISDALYMQVETTARERGLSNEELIRQLIQMWQSKVDERRHRQEVVQRIDALRERLFAAYGEMADSVELIRTDRAR
jgi:antitoxin component of RelBE/YafQ-DinJ toxin-antitoxin module